MLNVLRFASSKEHSVPSPLSERGQKILAHAGELCYLTQVVIRLFEDTQKPPEDPKRFRVEILFSPGATATPRHMAELHREKDSSRFDTEKLQKISIESLTCTRVEEFFEQAIREGKTKEQADESSKGTDGSDAENSSKKMKTKKDKTIKKYASTSHASSENYEKTVIGPTKVETEVTEAASDIFMEKNVTEKEDISVAAVTELAKDVEPIEQEVEEKIQSVATRNPTFWQNAAVTGFLVGASCCLFVAIKMAKRR